MLNDKAVKVRELCQKKGLDIVPAWVPRAANQLADMYSKSTDGDDWVIHNAVFRDLDKIWGKFTVDRFASSANRNGGALGQGVYIDGLRQVWAGQNNWLVPSPRLIPSVISKMMDEKAISNSTILALCSILACGSTKRKKVCVFCARTSHVTSR